MQFSLFESDTYFSLRILLFRMKYIRFSVLLCSRNKKKKKYENHFFLSSIYFILYPSFSYRIFYYIFGFLLFYKDFFSVDMICLVYYTFLINILTNEIYTFVINYLIKLKMLILKFFNRAHPFS